MTIIFLLIINVLRKSSTLKPLEGEQIFGKLKPYFLLKSRV